MPCKYILHKLQISGPHLILFKITSQAKAFLASGDGINNLDFVDALNF